MKYEALVPVLGASAATASAFIRTAIPSIRFVDLAFVGFQIRYTAVDNGDFDVFHLSIAFAPC